MTRLTYVDATRSTGAPGDPWFSPQRRLDVTIRYPSATPATAGNEANDAKPAAAEPLLVFAHGFGVSADTYATLEHELAAAGFVVAAPDFPLTSAATGNPLDRNDLTNQPADLSFLITQLTTPTTAPAVLSGAIGNGKVGVIGHSDGGITAAAVAFNACCADPRIGAAVVLSGAESWFSDSWFSATPPMLAIQGTADEINPFSSSEQLVADDPGPRLLIPIPGGSHLGPFTTDPTEPLVTTAIADYLRSTLEQDPNATIRLPTDTAALSTSP